MKKNLLIILDGWGISNNYSVSAIEKAKTPFIDYCYIKYPHSRINTFGLNVGLPKNQVGNSEVGHMNLGAGRIIYQNLVKINISINNGSFAKNNIINNAFHYATINNKKIHLIGLLSDGGVHSHINHIFAILDIAVIKKFKNIFIHAFTDGRDTYQKSGIFYLELLNKYINKTTGYLSTISGRYYAMDRNKNWIRTKKTYDAIVNGIGIKSSNIIKTIQNFYNNGITDEFIEPIIIVDSNNNPLSKIESNDVVISFNFRTDRSRQLTEVLTQKDFSKYNMYKMKLHYITMTSYNKNYKNIYVIFNNTNIKDTLGEVLENNNKKQLRIAETEKYPHVTFFFSGGREEPFLGEKRILCPSPNIKTYDLIPEMSALDICYKTINNLKSKKFDFICLNFANPDMVGHTGNIIATIKACEIVDNCSQMICKTALQNGYTVLIVSDHGNADFMINNNGTPNTSHTKQPTPCFLLGNKNFLLKNGNLADISPTILELMNINKPKLMTGNSLLIRKKIN